MSKYDAALLTLALLLMVTVLGCGGGGEPQAMVTGEVTFKGELVDGGMISFEPTGEPGPPKNVPVQEGTYEAKLSPGSYRVRISAADNPPAPDDIHEKVEYNPLLPHSWNVNSELDVELKEGKNTVHFRGDESGPNVEVAAAES